MNDTEKIGDFQQIASTNITRVVNKISITQGSQFNFPTAMYKKNNLSRFKSVRLFFNKKDSKVGIEFLPEIEEGAFKLIPSGEDGKYGAYIVAKSFFFLSDLKVKKYAGRYDYDKISLKKLGSERPGTMFVIDLNLKGGNK